MWQRRQHRRVVRAAVLELIEARELDECLERKTHSREIKYRLRPGIKMLMRRPIRYLQRTTRVPIKALPIDNAESLSPYNMNRFFAMHVLARVPADGDLRFENARPHGREAQLIADH